jgi:cephalosporin hydroxylase
LNIREQIKKRLTFEQRRRIIRTWVALRSTFEPGRIRARNLPKLPNGRKWRTALSNALLWTFQGGTLQYQYRDVPMLKQPFEVALYMRLIWETKPGTIIEIGSSSGGAAVWMSDLLKTFGIDGRVVSIDLQPPAPAYHPANVTFLRGDAHDIAATLPAELLSQFKRPWLVIEDAEHHYHSTLAVMQFFDPLLRSGEYLVIEDADILFTGQDRERDGGPARTIAEFLRHRGDSYEIDARYCDQYGYNVTGNPNGYLRKK